MQIEALKLVLEELRNWIDIIDGLANRKGKKEEDALSALLDALNETMIYLGRIEEDPEKIERDNEENLSRLWRQASQKVRPYNQELAKRCSDKGLYWGNPSYFTSAQIEEMQISITDIQKYAHKALQSA